jgi:hypothetical protein
MANPQITDFFTGLGYGPKDAIHVRLLPAKGFDHKATEHRALFPDLAYQKGEVWIASSKKLRLQAGKLVWQCKSGDKPIACTDPWEWVKAQSQKGYCPYIVVNPGGQTKSEITTGRVLFWEHDALDKPTQIERFMEYADRWGGAMAVETRNSIHCYIRLDQELAPKLIQPTLKRVIALMGSDSSVNDECRLMRIPGFDHIKMVETDGVWQVERFPVTLLHSWDGSAASWESIDRELPQAEPKKTSKSSSKQGARTATGESLTEILERDILPRLSAEQIFNWSGHDFKEQPDGKLKGNCPWHDSQSGTSFWVTPSQDGVTHTGACPTCTKNEKMNAIAYRSALRRGGPSGQPTGRDFVDVVRELAANAGVTLPDYDPNQSKSDQSESNPKTPTQAPWKCLPVHNYQLGGWKHIDIQNTNLEEVQRYHDRALSDPNLKYTGSRTDGKKDYEVFSEFEPRTNFDMRVSKVLEDSTGGGIEFEVIWLDRSTVRSRKTLVKTTEMLTVKDFVTALTRGLNGHFTSILKPSELAAIIENRKYEYALKGGKIYRLADRVGQQDDGAWVFESAQFKADGTPTTEQESRWMFNHALGEIEKVPSPQIAPQNPEALGNLAKAVEGFFHAETVPLTWFMCGYIVATMQRQAVMKQDHAFPQINLFGDAGGGKTTAAKVGASLIGMHGDRSIITRFSESLIYEQVKSLGGAGLILDDPVKKGMKQDSKDAVDNFIWAMFNGVSRRVRGNEQTPNTNVIVTSNVALGEGNQAIESRILKIHFPVHPVNESGFPSLEQAMSEATGGLSQLLSIQYDRETVREIRSRLLEHLTGSHSRISLSMALLVYFTQRFCDASGVNFDAFEYAVNHLCPVSNDFGSDKDSLTDFLEKLAIMRSEGKVGEWNVTEDKSKDLAIHLAGIWGGFQSQFNPNYSQQSLEQLIEGRGGSRGCVKKFVKTKQEWVDYERAINQCEMGLGRLDQDDQLIRPIKPSKSRDIKVVVVPRMVAIDAGFLQGDAKPNSSDPKPEATPEPIEVPQPEPTQESKPEPIVFYQMETTTASTPNLDLGTWGDEPALWGESDLEDARQTIKANPDARESFRKQIPRSQWAKAGLESSEVQPCAV